MSLRPCDINEKKTLQHTVLEVRSLLKETYKYKSVQSQSIKLLAEFFKVTKESFYKEPERLLTAKEEILLSVLLSRLQNKEPLAYILSYQDFWTSRFFVNPDVLIPRPETELLVEKALLFLGDLKKKSSSLSFKALDLASGSGCVGLSLLKEIPSLYCDFWDICSKALDVSQKNSELLQVDQERLKFFCKDILSSKSWDKASKYDILISNPPYISKDEKSEVGEEVFCFEPHKALFAKNNGLEFYHALTQFAPLHLNENGALLVEVGYKQASFVAKLFEEAGFVDLEIFSDFNGHPRVVKGVLRQFKR